MCFIYHESVVNGHADRGACTPECMDIRQPNPYEHKRHRRVSKGPICEYWVGLREHAVRSNPRAFIHGAVCVSKHAGLP